MVRADSPLQVPWGSFPVTVHLNRLANACYKGILTQAGISLHLYLLPSGAAAGLAPPMTTGLRCVCCWSAARSQIKTWGS